MDLNRSPRNASPGARPTAGNPNGRRWTLGAVAGVIAGATGGFGWLFSHSGTQAATAQVDPGCDLRVAPCSATFPGGERIGFAIAPDGIPLSQPLVLIVATGPLPASSVEVDLQGLGVDYGFNRTVLARTADGRFNGLASLPVCGSEDIAWQATVTVNTDRGPYVATFGFDTPASH